MEILSLKCLATLSETFHFRAAAEKLGMTQSNLSQHIKKIEKEWGVIFFERNNKTVRLTAEGKAHIKDVKKILNDLIQLDYKIRESQDKISGLVTLSAIPTMAPYILPKLIPLLAKTAPNISLTIREETTSVLIKNIKEGKSDIGILALPITDEGLVTRKITSDDFYLAVPKKHELTQKKAITPQDLSGEKFLMLQEGHCFRDQALEFCERSQQNPNVVFEGSSLNSILNLVAIGYGITFIPALALDYHSHSRLKFIPFKAPSPQRDLGICWRFTMPLTKTQRHIIDCIEMVLPFTRKTC